IVNDDDDLDTDDVKIYRKVKEAGEFGTVFKMVNKVLLEVQETETPETEPVEVVEINFTDITEEFKYAETAILEMAKKGIIDGVGDGKYDPSGEFTRAQFCKIIVEALGYVQKDYAGQFSDVAATDWYASYVQAAVESGIFQGYPDGVFMPNKIITRQE